MRVVIFDSENKAYDGVRALAQLGDQGSIRRLMACNMCVPLAVPHFSRATVGGTGLDNLGDRPAGGSSALHEPCGLRQWNDTYPEGFKP